MLGHILLLAATSGLVAFSGPLTSDVLQYSESSRDQSHQSSNAVSWTQFRNVQTDLCLDEPNRNRIVTTNSCNRGLTQSWERYGRLLLRNKVSKRCLKMSMRGQVSTEDCNVDSVFQQWDVSSKLIRNVRNNMCVNEKARGELCNPYLINQQWNHIL